MFILHGDVVSGNKTPVEILLIMIHTGRHLVHAPAGAGGLFAT